MSSMHIRCNLHLFAFWKCPSYSINFGSEPYIVGSNYPLPGFCLPTILLKTNLFDSINYRPPFTSSSLRKGLSKAFKDA